MTDLDAPAEARSPRPRAYGVRQVRGPFVRLPAHPDAVESTAELEGMVHTLRQADPDVLLAADLFAGAGGLSLGLDMAGVRTVFAVDHDAQAVETYRHHFPGLTVDWDLADPEIVAGVGDLLKRLRIQVVAGGPPCQPFSKAGRSGIRHHVRTGLREPHDRRRDLWQSYMEIIRIARPAAVIMENVPDMALDREMFILRSMVLELEGLGYGVEERVVDTWRYGVPQFRQRLILVALRDRLRFAWPEEVALKTTVENAIGDLPVVAGGWRPAKGADGWKDYEGPHTAFQRLMRAGVDKADESKVFDHITRPVREDDLEAFELMDANTRYSQLPDHLKRYRDDIFDDKYKRLNAHDLSRTITAHIAKDGYWYIHPVQNRTLTVREAARLQTFPDRFRFAGPPSAAFRQIGNAVPPLLGKALGGAIVDALGRNESRLHSSEEVADALAEWYEGTELHVSPWLKAETRWQVICAEILLDKAVATHVRYIWPLLRRWGSPLELLADAEDFLEIGKWIGRQNRAERIVSIAETLQCRLRDRGRSSELGDDLLQTAVQEKVIPQSVADIAVLAVPVGDEDESEEPVIINKGVLRVAGRFIGDSVDRRNRLTDGRLAVARMIGYGVGSRRAHLALMELSNTLCRPAVTECTVCPLAEWCASSKAEDLRASRLPIAGLTTPIREQ